MRPLELLPTTMAEGSDPGVGLASLDAYIDLYAALGPVERFAVHAAATLLIATVILGLIPDSGSRTVAKCRRSPVISLCIGVPFVAILASLSVLGYLMIGTSLGTFFGVFLVVIGLLTLPAWAVLGFVATGQTLAKRAGIDRLWVGILVGTLASGLVAVSPVTAVLIGSLVAAVGTGAGVRVVLGFRGTADPSERTVPPANKV